MVNHATINFFVLLSFYFGEKIRNNQYSTQFSFKLQISLPEQLGQPLCLCRRNWRAVPKRSWVTSQSPNFPSCTLISSLKWCSIPNLWMVSIIFNILIGSLEFSNAIWLFLLTCSKLFVRRSIWLGTYYHQHEKIQ